MPRPPTDTPAPEPAPAARNFGQDRTRRADRRLGVRLLLAVGARRGRGGAVRSAPAARRGGVAAPAAPGRGGRPPAARGCAGAPGVDGDAAFPVGLAVGPGDAADRGRPAHRLAAVPAGVAAGRSGRRPPRSGRADRAGEGRGGAGQAPAPGSGGAGAGLLVPLGPRNDGHHVVRGPAAGPAAAGATPVARAVLGGGRSPSWASGSLGSRSASTGSATSSADGCWAGRSSC